MNIIIDEIFKIESEIKYINHYICRVQLKQDKEKQEFHIGFSIEYRAIGLPEVTIKYIDNPTPLVLSNEENIKSKIIEMDRTGSLRKQKY